MCCRNFKTKIISIERRVMYLRVKPVKIFAVPNLQAILRLWMLTGFFLYVMKVVSWTSPGILRNASRNGNFRVENHLSQVVSKMHKIPLDWLSNWRNKRCNGGSGAVLLEVRSVCNLDPSWMPVDNSCSDFAFSWIFSTIHWITWI